MKLLRSSKQHFEKGRRNQIMNLIAFVKWLLLLKDTSDRERVQTLAGLVVIDS